MKVEIRSYRQDHINGKLLCTWTLGGDGHAMCTNPTKQAELEHDGIVAHGRYYYPKDGEDFLRNYPYEYVNSSFIRAIVVE